MTIAASTARVQYAGDGSTTAFTVTFLFYEHTEILVVHTDAAGVDTAWVKDTDYTVAGGVDANSDPQTGTVTAITAPASGAKVTILRAMDFKQETDFPEGGSFPAKAQEQQHDKAAMALQELREKAARALKFKDSSTQTDIDVPEPEAGKVLAWNAGATGLENVSNAGGGGGGGTMAAQDADSVAITGGSIAGITDLAVANGGTGASTASGARTNLGLGALATENDIDNANWSGADLAVANGGTGASDASGARSNLGLGALATKGTVNDDDWSGTDLAVANGGTGASDAGTARTNLSAAVDTITQGLHTISVDANALVARTTNGPAAATVETSTNKIMLAGLDFDASTVEYAQFRFRSPKSWDQGDLKVSFKWTDADTAGTGTCRWGARAVCIRDDDAIDTAFNTGRYVADPFIASGDLHVTNTTTDITPGGTAGERCWIIIDVHRDAANVGDTYTQDARLLGIDILYTTNDDTDD